MLGSPVACRIVARGLLVAAMSVGCTRDDSASQGDPQPAVPGVATVEVELSVPAAPTVLLVAAGAEPRAVMRYRPEAGSTEKLEIALRTRMEVEGEAAMPPTAFPRIVVRSGVEVLESDDSLIRVRQSLGEVEVESGPETPERLTADLRRQLRSLEAYRADLVADPRGWLLSGTLELPADVEPSGRQVLRQIGEAVGRVSVPLPAEPIGVGAQWTATTTVVESGQSLTRRTTYQWIRSEDDAPIIEYTADLVGQATMQGVVKGRVRLDVGRWAPDRAKTRTQLDFPAPGGAGRVKMDVSVDILRE